MSHFAKVENGIVTEMIVAEQDLINSGAMGDANIWIQVSYNTRGGVHYSPETGIPDGGVALRKNYPGVGYVYDAQRDAFYLPKPFPSWTLDESTCYWNPPVPYPTDGARYEWDELNLKWTPVITPQFQLSQDVQDIINSILQK